MVICNRLGSLAASSFGAIALAAAAFALPQQANAQVDHYSCRSGYIVNRHIDTCHSTGYSYLAYRDGSLHYPHNGYYNGAGSYSAAAAARTAAGTGATSK